MIKSAVLKTDKLSVKSTRWLSCRSRFKLLFLFAFIFINVVSAFAGPSTTTYQAKIIKPDGQPLEAATVNFRFSILNPAGNCVVYIEDHLAVNMTSTGGLISFALGSGIKAHPVSATTFEDVFSNITPSLTCDAGGNYSPGADHTRKIIMQFHDGGGWQTLPAMSINAVPYAMYANDAQNLGGVSATAFVQASMIPSCGVSEAVRYNGTSFSCVAVGGPGGGSVTSGSVITALGYTPADGASVTTLISNLNSTNTNVSSVSATVTALSVSMATITSTVASMTSSQWLTSGTAISYNAGNVGIGVSSPANLFQVNWSPAANWEIQQDIDKFGNGIALKSAYNVASPAGEARLNFYKSRGTLAAPGGVLAGDFIGTLGFRGTNASGTSLSAAAIRVIAAQDFINSAAGSHLTFQTTPSGTTTSTEKLRIDPQGFVGIGTTTPVTRLDVSGGVRIGTESATCTSGYSGTLRYNSGVVEYCNGTTWAAFGVSGAGILAINGLTSGSQTFALGTAGLTANVSSTGSVHTINIPLAATPGVAAGLVTNADYNNLTNSITSTATSFTAVATSFTSVANNISAVSSAVSSLSANTAASFAAITSSQWITSGTGIGYTTGNVGINTSSPRQNLDVAPAAGNAILRATTTNAAAALQLYQNMGGGNYRGPVLWSNGGNLNFGHDTSENAGPTLMALTTTGYLGVGTLAPSDILHIQKSVDSRALIDSVTGSSGLELRTGSVSSAGGGYIDFASSATTHLSPDFDFRIISNSAGLNIQTPGANTRFLVNADGLIGIGNTTPSAKLHLAAGTTSLAPLKLTSGALATTPVSGAVEYDGSYYYITDGTNTRRAIATVANPGTFDNASNLTSTGNMTLTPVGSVIVSSTTASTNSQTGALIVKGGVGISGDINASGTLNVTGAATFGSNIFGNGNIHTGGGNRGFWMDAPGSFNYGLWRDPSDNVHLRSGGTTNRLTIASSTGWVGIGTNPGSPLHVMDRQAIENNLNTAAGPNIAFWKNRNYAATQNNDELGYLSFYGHDGSTTLRSAYIIANAEGAPTPGSVPGGLRFFTTTAGQGDSTEKMRITASGNIGIGTSNPTVPLHILTTGNANISIQTTASGAGGAALNLVTASNSGSSWQLVKRDDGYLGAPVGAFMINNSVMAPFVITNSGNVGIGTTVPANKLSVTGIIAKQTTTGIDGAYDNVFKYGHVTDLESGTSAANRWHGLDASITAGGAANNKLKFRMYAGTAANSAPVDVMTIQGDGSVGIGTTSPTEALDVSGSIKASSYTFYSPTGDPVPTITARTVPAGQGAANEKTELILFHSNDFNNGAGNDQITLRAPALSFQTYSNPVVASITDNGGYNERMHIAGTGEIGINTTTPTNALTVSNTSVFNPTSNVSSAIMIGGPNSAGQAFGGGVLMRDHVYYGGMWMTGLGTVLSFAAGGSASGFPNTSTLAVTASGAVGIGTNAPTEKLEVVGNIKVSGEVYSTRSWGFKKAPIAFVTDYINSWSSGYHAGTSIDCTSSANGCSILKSGTYEIRCVQRASSTTSTFIGIALNGDRVTLEGYANGVWSHDHSISPGGFTESNYMGQLTAGQFITCGPPTANSALVVYAANAYNGTLTIKRID